MQKAKKYDWKDSNLALFGSDTEKQVKKESAESEPAWKGAGQKVGLQIWRIVQFKVQHWDKEEYGKFYDGDSYIILNTYKEEEELKYDVHFWIGKYSTQDEYGTAAYKTVELDTFLDDKPVQHREVQGHESTIFKSYFNSITLLKGGADTGFRRVLPEEYTPRLLIVKKTSKIITAQEVSLSRNNLDSNDVFILDTGLTIYQWNGNACSHDEKFKAAQVTAEMKSSRKARVEVLEERSTSPEHPFYSHLKDTDVHSDEDKQVKGEQKMLRVSDAGGKLDYTVVKEDGLDRNLLSSEDVFILNTGSMVFVWIGKGASIGERKNAIPYASNYLSKTETPWLPITVVAEGKESAEFNKCIPSA